MSKDIGPIVCAILVGIGLVLLITGVGGGGYSFTTGRWYFSHNTTPTETRIVGALMIAFVILLLTMKRK
ncbi:MAG: hypothetical protein ACREQQ_03585 [Candidatus Binatia bacterium]